MNRKDYLRPVFGTLVLQPLAMWWCYLTETPYLSNVGIFTIVATVYLIPVYAFYEKLWEKQ